MLESNRKIISKTRDNDVATRIPFPPLLDP